MTADTLLAQSAVDRLTSGAHTLIIEGLSHRQRQRARPRSQLTPAGNQAPKGLAHIPIDAA